MQSIQKNRNRNFALIGTILVLLGVFLPVAGLALPSPLSTIGAPVIKVVDASGTPISGAYVFLFAGGGGIEAKEAAAYSFTTGADGVADLAGIAGFYRVGVIKNGYVAADSTHTPNSGWVNIWSAWGAAGLNNNMIYTIRLTNTGANIPEPNTSPTATPTPTAEPDDAEKPFFGRVFNYVTLSGIGFVVAGLVLNRRRK